MPDDEESEVDTLGGLIFSMLGRVPARGELIRHPSGIEFEVLDADPRRVKKVKIHTSRTLSQAQKRPQKRRRRDGRANRRHCQRWRPRARQ